MGLKKVKRGVAASIAAIIWLANAGAIAHPMLEAASPRVGAIVPIAPREISLSFSERVQSDLSTILLTTEDGSKVDLAEAVSSGSSRSLVAKILRPLASGRYYVNWSVVSADGHSAVGDFKFTVNK